MTIKNTLKKCFDYIFDFFFRKRKYFPFLKLFPRARNYIYDIINFKAHNKIKIILDVGANIGQSALYYNKFFSKCQIHCFEPIASTYATLQNNTKTYTNINLHNFALGEKEEAIDVPYITNFGSNSLIHEVNKNFSTSSIQKVEVKTIDRFIHDSKIEHVDILKIDTEGFDYKVLLGAQETLSAQKIDFIVCEVGFLYENHKGNFEQINSYLHEKGYWLSGFYDNYYWGSKFILHGFTNAMYIRKNLAFQE
ncbi:FkbM family methyltransferase [Winogradskyella sp.]|nr:FkbM family methyltransferase [Winogradskyella sp.]